MPKEFQEIADVVAASEWAGLSWQDPEVQEKAAQCYQKVISDPDTKEKVDAIIAVRLF